MCIVLRLRWGLGPLFAASWEWFIYLCSCNIHKYKLMLPDQALSRLPAQTVSVAYPGCVSTDVVSVWMLWYLKSNNDVKSRATKVHQSSWGASQGSPASPTAEFCTATSQFDCLGGTMKDHHFLFTHSYCCLRRYHSNPWWQVGNVWCKKQCRQSVLTVTFVAFSLQKFGVFTW